MGEVFAGRYELIDMLGEGGMGTVWRAHDRKHDVLVAAKVLRQADAGSLLRFMREQGMRIRHPHVLTPLGWAGEDDRVLFTLPLVDGGSLSDLLRRHGAVPPFYAAEIVRQLLDALTAVHDSGIVHRDVKPANLLLDAVGEGRPHLRLTDFGVALPVDQPRMTRANMVLGTPGYLAPEQIRGADPDLRQDLYAVGQVAKELITGERIGPDEETKPLNLHPETPAALAEVIRDLIAMDPEQRPSSAQEARQRLDVPELAWPEQGQHVSPPQQRVVLESILPAMPAQSGTFTEDMPLVVGDQAPTSPLTGPGATSAMSVGQTRQMGEAAYAQKPGTGFGQVDHPTVASGTNDQPTVMSGVQQQSYGAYGTHPGQAAQPASQGRQKGQPTLKPLMWLVPLALVSALVFVLVIAKPWASGGGSDSACTFSSVGIEENGKVCTHLDGGGYGWR